MFFINTAVVHRGKKHGNCGKTLINTVRDLVNYIRKNYRDDVTIIVKIDSGFFNKVNFALFDELGVVFIARGKTYNDVNELARRRRTAAPGA